MKSIHGKELFNYVASFREDARLSRLCEEDMPTPQWASHLRDAARKHFGIDQEALSAASDEQVVCALGYAGMKRVQSRYHAQVGMVFAAASVASPFLGLGLAFPVVWGLCAAYKLSAAYKEQEKALACAKRGAKWLKDEPSRNSEGRLQLFV